jgi:hypothetical protein
VFRERTRLAELGLAPPVPAQVMQRLRERGYPILDDGVTVSEAEQAIAGLLGATA